MFGRSEMKGQNAKLCILDEWGCELDEQRFYDSETKQWGFDIVCLNKAHKNVKCPSEREILRLDPIHGE